MLPTRCVFGLKDECEAIIFVESLMSRVEEVKARDGVDDIKKTIMEVIDAYIERIDAYIERMGGRSVEREVVNMLAQFCSICPHRAKSGGIDTGTVGFAVGPITPPR
jgi:hypothetical protein